MKTRIFKTKFWTDSKTLEWSLEARYLFVYLITCSSIGLNGIFECSEQMILFETGLSKKKLQVAKEQLAKAGRVYFFNEWIWIVNVERHNNYRNSESNEQAYQREIEFIPSEVKKNFETRGYSTPPSTQKPKYKNNKPKKGEEVKKFE